MCGCEEGQATVEAALLLPALMVCLALLVQPACILYTRAAMQSAAAEACRLLATPPSSSGVSEQSYRAYVLRRLSAVPDVDIFHVGGDAGWDVSFERLGEGRTVRVSIGTSVRPLPLLGVLASLLGEGDGSGGVRIEVAVQATVRPSWLEGGYGDWSSIWD